MANLTGIATDIADEALGDIAFRLTQKAAKAVGTAENIARQPVTAVDVTGAIRLDTEGYRATMLAPSKYASDPELFYGPFLQVGSYFKLGPDWLQFVIDSVADPLNLVTLGTGGLAAKAGVRGLTESGKLASLTSTLGRVAQAKKAASGGKITGAMVVDEAIEALTAAGRLIEAGPDELLKAARAGDKALVRHLKAAEALTPDAGTSRLLAALRRDRKALATILDETHGMVDRGPLSPASFLQETYLGRVATRQSRPLVGVIRPASPIADPLRFTRQLMGFSYGDDDVIMPGSMLLSEGLDRALGRLPGEALPGGVGDIGRAMSAFTPRPFRAGDVTAAHAYYGIQAAKAVIATPGAPYLRSIGAGDVTDADLHKAYNYLRGAAEDAEIDPAKYQEWAERYATNLRSSQIARDRVNNKIRNAGIDRAVADMHARADAAGVDIALRDGWESSIRTIADLFGSEQLAFDAISPGNAMAARVSTMRLIAHTTATNQRAVLRRLYPGKRTLGVIRTSGAADDIAEVLPRLVDSPDLWRIDPVSGRAFLKREMLDQVATEDVFKSKSPLLRKTIERTGGARAENELLAHLVDDGLEPEAVELAAQMKELFDETGENLLFNEGITERFLSNYFTRVFEPNDRFYTEYKGQMTAAGNEFAQRLMLGKDDDKALLAELHKAEIGTKDMLAKARKGKITPAELRKWTEAAAVHAEEKGWGRIKMDGIELFSGYVDDVNQALLISRLVNELPSMVPGLSREVVRMYFGNKVADSLSEKALGYGRVHIGELPPELRSGEVPLYRKLSFKPVTEARKSMDREVAHEALRRTLIGTARRDGATLAAERAGFALDGAKEINGFKLVGPDGKPMPFRKEWVTQGVPDELRGARTVNGWLRHDIKTAEIEQEIIDSVIADWAERDAKIVAKAGAQRAKATALRRAAAHDARESVAKRLHGSKTLDGAALYDASGNPVELDASWVLGNQVPEGVFGIKGRGKNVPKEKLSAAELRRRIKREVDAEAVSESIQKRVDARYRALSKSASVQDAKAIATDMTRRSALEESKRAVARRFPKARFKGKDIVDSATGQKVRLKEEWIIDTDTMPKTIVARREIRTKIRQEIDADFARKHADGAVRTSKRSLRAAARSMSFDDLGPVEKNDIWVFAPDFGKMQEAFRLYSTEGVTNKYLRWFDRAVRYTKSVVLLGDVFHYNVLATSQFAALSTLNPREMLNAFRDETGALLPGVQRAAFRAAAGGVTGGLVGSGLSEDEGDIATFSLAGAIYGALIGGATANARYARNLALNPQHLDTIRWMGIGGWTGRPDDRSIGVVQRGLRALEESLRDSPALRHPATGARHVLDAWDDQLWGVMHNGSKHFYFDVTWRREVELLENSREFGEDFLRAQHAALKEGGKVTVPHVAEDAELTASQFVRASRQRMKSALAREIVQSSNNAFGGQAMSNLFANPEWQRNMRRVMLAPDWTGSQLAMTSNVFLNMSLPRRSALGALIGSGIEMAEMGFDPQESEVPWRGVALGAALGAGLGGWANRVSARMFAPGDVMAKEARRMSAAALIGGYVFINLLNKAFTGRWAFENEEGQKIGIELPGETDSGRKRYIKLGKPWLEAWEFAGVAHKENYPIPVVSRARSKLNVPVSTTISLFENRNFFGAIVTGEDSPADIAVKLTHFAVDAVGPIISQGPVRAITSGFEPQETAAAAIRFGGFQVSTGRQAGALPTIGEAIRPPVLSDAPFLSL